MGSSYKQAGFSISSGNKKKQINKKGGLVVQRVGRQIHKVSGEE